jgi:hypothetical protein
MRSDPSNDGRINSTDETKVAQLAHIAEEQRKKQPQEQPEEHCNALRAIGGVGA